MQYKSKSPSLLKSAKQNFQLSSVLWSIDAFWQRKDLKLSLGLDFDIHYKLGYPSWLKSPKQNCQLLSVWARVVAPLE